MIICNREEANKLIEQESNLFKSDVRNQNNDIVSDYLTSEIKRGRGNVEDLGDEVRKEIATLALTTGLSNEEVSKLIGVSESQVSAIKKGATSTASYHKRDGELGEHVAQVKNEITSAAQNKMLEAIQAITGMKIQMSNAKEISGIAKDMSSIVRNMNPDGPAQITNNQVVVFRPRNKEEDDFKVIDVSLTE